MTRPTLLVAMVLIAASCGSPQISDDPTTTAQTAPFVDEPSSTTTGDPTAEEEQGDPGEIQRPPPVEVSGGGISLSLEAWTACWGNGCYHGRPPVNPADIGDPDEIIVEFPEEGWEFIATVTPVGEECGRSQTEPLEPVGATAHRLVPIGLAGVYDVTLFGRGPGGDLFVSFRWTTPTNGTMPVPAAMASILADHDGQIDSYGVEVPVWNLAETPESATGQVTVTSSEGNTHTFDLTREDLGCSEGSIYFTAPIDEGLTAAGLGNVPFTYELTLELDGATYVGTGVWPNEVDPECAPCVPLTFAPPLPALAAGRGAEGVEAVQIDDVWVFQHDPVGWDDALHGGSAEIKDGCLYVDGAIVVWHVDEIDEVGEIIANLKAGQHREVLIGGGGISLDEGASPEDITATITDRCATSAVWFGAPSSS
jgi:hypothetical protein